MRDSKITFLLGYSPNPRMQKRIQVASAVASVQLVQWDKDQDKLSLYDSPDLEKHIITIKSSENPLQRIPEYFKFQKNAISKLRQIKPDVIHLQGLDMLAIASNYKKKYDAQVSIIYEIADMHRYLIEKPKSIQQKLIHNSLVSIEKRSKKYVNKLILTSPKYYEVYYNRFYNNNEHVIFENYPDLSVFNNFKTRDFYTNPLRVSYIGGVRYKEQIEILLNIASELPIEISIAGYEDGEPEIENRAKSMDNVKWYGSFDYKTDINSLYEEADVIFSVYNADIYNVRIALPNKFYEAIYCQKPIIVAKDTYLAERVERLGVGLAVDCHSHEELKGAIKYIANKNNYAKISENCKSSKSLIKDGRHIDELTEIYNNALAKS